MSESYGALSPREWTFVGVIGAIEGAGVGGLHRHRAFAERAPVGAWLSSYRLCFCASDISLARRSPSLRRASLETSPGAKAAR